MATYTRQGSTECAVFAVRQSATMGEVAVAASSALKKKFGKNADSVKVKSIVKIQDRK